jgi:hypothetical protein
VQYATHPPALFKALKRKCCIYVIYM